MNLFFRLMVVAMLIASPIHAAIGYGSRSQTVAFDGISLRVDTYRPNCSNPDILIDHHGSSRSWYPNGAKPLADRKCMVVVAPIFPESRFNSDSYQRGGVVTSRGAVKPASQWTTRLEKFIVNWAKAEVGGSPKVYIFGFSAGGQFLSRVAAYSPVPGITRYIVGAPSSWVRPQWAITGSYDNMPYGFNLLGTSTIERAAAQAYLALPLTVYVGSDDNNPDDPDLGSAPGQGDTRLDRARNTYNEARDVANANGWPFNWRLVIAQGVGHSGTSMLRAPEIEEVFKEDVTSLPCTCPQ